MGYFCIYYIGIKRIRILPNPYAIPLNLDAELGQAIKHVIDKTGYGYSTFIVKEFMEKHKDELLQFWDSQGKKGQAIFDKWFYKWSLSLEEQKEKREHEENEKLQQLATKYESLGCGKKQASRLARDFPTENPLTVMKTLTYANQNEIAEPDFECSNCGFTCFESMRKCPNCKKEGTIRERETES